VESLELMPIRVRITSILRRAIYSGEYRSGQELSLTEVAEGLGISRTPVREAFQTLAAEGLITLRMNKGAIVNPIDAKFIQDIFEMRLLLEGEAAFRCARNGADVSSLLERVAARQNRKNALSREDYEALNQELHLTLWTAADNARLKAYLQELWNGPSAGPSEAELLSHYKDSDCEHLRVLEAVRDRDAERARREMESHIRRSMENILKRYI
jgi:DNA-binding GntR family transcriptional regulator